MEILDQEGNIEGWFIPFKTLDDFFQDRTRGYESLTKLYGDNAGIAIPNDEYWISEDYFGFIENLRKFQQDIRHDPSSSKYDLFSIPYLRMTYNPQAKKFKFRAICKTVGILPTLYLSSKYGFTEYLKRKDPHKIAEFSIDRVSSWFNLEAYKMPMQACYATFDAPEGYTAFCWWLYGISKSDGWLHERLAKFFTKDNSV